MVSLASKKGDPATPRKRTTRKAVDTNPVSPKATRSTVASSEEQSLATAKMHPVSSSTQAEQQSAPTGAAQARYPLYELIQHADSLFGVKPEVMHGVFHDAVDRTFTIEEVHTQIQQFMKAKVE